MSQPAASEFVIRCPNCGGRDVRRSQPGGFIDSVMSAIQRVPYRCRGCQKRFYRRPPDPDETGESGSIENTE